MKTKTHTVLYGVSSHTTRRRNSRLAANTSENVYCRDYYLKHFANGSGPSESERNVVFILCHKVRHGISRDTLFRSISECKDVMVAVNSTKIELWNTACKTCVG